MPGGIGSFAILGETDLPKVEPNADIEISFGISGLAFAGTIKAPNNQGRMRWKARSALPIAPPPEPGQRNALFRIRKRLWLRFGLKY